jgi:hypothetical protein
MEKRNDTRRYEKIKGNFQAILNGTKCRPYFNGTFN